MKNALIIILLLVINSSIIFGQTDGVVSLRKRLKPIKINSFRKISGISGIARQDHLAGINGKGEFITIQIDHKLKAHLKTVVPKFPPFDGWELKSDNEYNFIWKTRGRGLYALDIETQKTGHCISSNNGNDKVVNTQLIDPENKIFMIELSRLGPGLSGLAGFIYVLYDLNRDKIIFESEIYAAHTYRLNDQYNFHCDILGKDHDILKWYLIDKSNKKIENKLTQKMTDMQINIWPKTKGISVKQKMMIGTSKTIKNAYFSIRWDEKFEEIKIEPIIRQRPDGNFMDEAFEFSGDGKWIKTLRFPFNNGREMPPELMFFHVSDNYPQGLSQPILCGFTWHDTPGAFMDHSKLGMCYVQLSGDHTLNVYVLNEGLRILGEESLGGQ